MFIPVIANQPAGLAIYWITTNFWSLGQQIVIQQVMPMPTPPTPEEAGEGRAPTPTAAQAEEAPMSDEALEGAGDEPIDRVASLLDEIVDALDLDAEIIVDETDEEIAARVEGDELGLLIGRRGQTIDAVQLLCYRVAFRGRGERKRVSVDAAGYRERRRETVERQAERAAERALETGKEIELEPMTANRAQDRPRPAQGPSRARDLQRGRGARPLRDRRPAGRRLIDQTELHHRLDPVLALLAEDPASLSSIRDPRRGMEGPRRGLALRARVGRAPPAGSRTSAPARGSRASCSRRRCPGREST